MNLRKNALLLCMFLACSLTIFAQNIQDGETIDVNGLKVTFNITNEEKMEIKGAAFVKYKVTATVKNSSGKSYNVRLNNYPDANSIGGGKLVQLDCINATGAKLTSKKFDVSMKRHDINVTYLTRDKDNKLINSTITVTAGFYLEDGDTVTNNAQFIVPEGEKPKVNVRSLR